MTGAGSHSMFNVELNRARYKNEKGVYVAGMDWKETNKIQIRVFNELMNDWVKMIDDTGNSQSIQ